MAFTYNRIGKVMYGQVFVSELYTYTSAGGSTGGSIVTGMERIIFVKIVEKDTAGMAALAALNTTLPNGNTFTVVTTADKSGYCWVLGSA